MNADNELTQQPPVQPQQLPLPSGPRPDRDTLLAALQGLLFVHHNPIPTQRIAEILELPFSEAELLLNEFRIRLDESPLSGLQVIITEQGVQLATKAFISSFIQRLEGQKLVSLSLPALETLAVIAFKQPITRAEIEAIRGVNCDGVVATLLEKKLIFVSGEKPVLGRPRLYSTTQDFLYYFGIKSLKELSLPEADLPGDLPPSESRDVTAEMDGERSLPEEEAHMAADAEPGHGDAVSAPEQNSAAAPTEPSTDASLAPDSMVHDIHPTEPVRENDES
ncbi:SMC-Scp complex subunit ScpB [Candidatus Ozemobacteraceae bacterium]|nr:SMC-Scp complex subunit ScpB [Candidatus Ozemobacteraceae bacterium]